MQLNACRSCSSAPLQEVLSYGVTPLANNLLTAAELQEAEARYPLDLMFCPRCSLVQIPISPSPKVLFSDYLYFSSFSETMLRHAERLVGECISRYHLKDDSLVVEVASNDGYLLQYYQRAGIPVLGIEPAANVAQWARERRQIRTLERFFNEELAHELDLQADVIHANNVFAHVPDLADFLRGVKRMLKPDGVCIIEVPYVRKLIDQLEFDTVYHEHVYYFSMIALQSIVAGSELVLLQVEQVEIHGGSLRLYIGTRGTPDDSCARLLAAETQLGLDRFDYYASFSQRVRQLGEQLRSTLQTWKSQGRKIAAYGAAAKGTTLLNLFQIDTELIDFVVDRSPHKQGLFLPGVHIPVLAPEALLERRPDYTVILAWNFAQEIVAQQAAYVAAGGRFLLPLPQVTVLEP